MCDEQKNEKTVSGETLAGRVAFGGPAKVRGGDDSRLDPRAGGSVAPYAAAVGAVMATDRDYRGYRTPSEKIKLLAEQAAMATHNAAKQRQELQILSQLIDAHPEFATFFELAMKHRPLFE